ncbi:hypothetical protein H4R18_001111 [Coemansia javaensis]|uniref:Pyridoxamine 5'-phosphate oxidase N-terminal domain-containing protein n=1 Tax=Coemansia javaensis TaxID=2761396 RepID=A0A9W8HI32_9FUNG|nr:hypothetical protein H4R18_001111 [Coemansia javaensis]
MGTFREGLTDADQAWVRKQRIYFLATAPRGGGGHVNASPKGYDTLRVVGSNRIVLLDGLGSGCETISHVRENGRITIMLCAFEGAPRIMRLFGRGTVHEPGTAAFDDLFEAHFAADWRSPDKYSLVRSLIDVRLDLVGQSCGFGVPLMEYKEDRATLINYAKSQPAEKHAAKRAENNTLSIDGIPSFLRGTAPGAAVLVRRSAAAVLPWVGTAALGAALALGATRFTTTMAR